MNAPSRRYLSVWLRRLSTDRIERRSPAPDDIPLIAVEPVKSAVRICTLNDAAAVLGLKAGMPLADARAMFPSIKVQDVDRQADLALLEAIADWCCRYTPLVGLDPSDGLMLDISGCAHLFGGERPLGRDILSRLERQGLHAEIGLADTVGCAWAVARYHKTKLVPKNAMRQLLLPLPLAALRLNREIVSELALAGLKRVADIIDCPRAPLAARFGEGLVRRLDQALGHEDESITPRLPPPSYVAERRFPGPIVLEADVLGTIEQLAHELGRLLEQHGQGARLLETALFRVDGKVHRIKAGTAEALRDPECIRRLFVERLAAVGDECDPGFGYDVVRLSVLACERLDPAQNGLAGQDYQTELAHLVDRLSARFGPKRLTRPVPRNTHIPELAVATIPAQIAQEPFPTASFEQDSLAPVRPLRLFSRPEEIEAIAEVPDGPPVRFRWRHRLYELAAVEGPERIGMEWWRGSKDHALTRDYFRVESRQGLRAWLYREGLYEAGNRPRWFLHGLFA
jgi:protein ImuB